MHQAAPVSQFISAPDGLRLHARLYGSGHGQALPVVCLPGLTRTAADFEELATALSGDTNNPRRVIALDYRGRGQSDFDPSPSNYNFQIELADVLAVTTALGASPAIYVGTSRGGILAMLMAAVRPSALAGVVLNDIGPVIEMQGLMRIKGYVGKLPQPRNVEDAAEMLRRLFGAQFPRLTPADWQRNAQRSFKADKGALVPTYDTRLAQTLAAVNPDQPMPVLWAQYAALSKVPVMVIRGALSDLLSPATVAAMRQHHPGLDAMEIPDQGHAPLLAEADTIARIAEFVRRCDGHASASH